MAAWLLWGVAGWWCLALVQLCLNRLLLPKLPREALPDLPTLSVVIPARDEEADLEVHWIPLADAVAMVFEGTLVNSSCVAGVLAVHAVQELRSDVSGGLLAHTDVGDVPVSRRHARELRDMLPVANGVLDLRTDRFTTATTTSSYIAAVRSITSRWPRVIGS